MSGSFEKLDVPPTLVSFAVTMAKTGEIMSPETKEAGHRLILIETPRDAEGLPDPAGLKETFRKVTVMQRSGRAFGAYAPGQGGVLEAVMKMSFGNGLGFRFADGWTVAELPAYRYGDLIVEVADTGENETVLGEVTADGMLSLGAEQVSLESLREAWEGRLESVYPCNIPTPAEKAETIGIPAREPPAEQCVPASAANPPHAAASAQRSGAPAVRKTRPRVLIPAFPGTNCEYDSARAVRDAGADAHITVITNLTSDAIARSVETFAREIRQSQIIFIPGGFSGGDEPDGSAKFITAFFRNQAIREAVTELLEERDGLMCGICNGFQALIKLGLVPFGKIIEADEHCPTLTFNTIGRHQSRIVRTRVASNRSPWLRFARVGEIYSVPISHGEGRFLAEEDVLRRLVENDQIATQYVDLAGNATMDVRFNPNGSMQAIEGIISPDGRVFGKMGHSERVGRGLYRNVPGNYDIRMFEAAVAYFK